MAQLRQDYDQFEAREAEIIVLGPEKADAFARYWKEKDLPFVGLPNPKSTILKLYGQEVKLFKLGRMPAQLIVDRGGTVRYVHYGHSMSDIPPNEELLALLDQLNQESDDR
jgi:peroxiredoxin Q/BCP